MTQVQPPTCAETTTDPRRIEGVPWRAVALFAVLALGLAWVASLPLWLGDGLAHPSLTLIIIMVMTTPAIAGAIVTFGYLRPAAPWRFLGISGGSSWRRTTAWAVTGSVGAIALTSVMVLLGSAFGLADIDQMPGALGALFLIPVFTVVIGVTAVGEEIGWRGFLHTALRPLGPVRALLLNGVLWGVWHTPLLLLGYNYATTSPVSIPLMVISTILIGTMLAWLRERTGTVWAGALAHGAMNVSASYLLAAFVLPAQQTPTLTLLGWVGWLTASVAIALLVATGGFRGWSRQR